MNFKDTDDSPFETWHEERSLWQSKPWGRKKRKVFRFYETYVWRTLRQKVLDRYGHECMRCGNISASPHVDHIKPRFYYPELELEFDNLQVLCKECNKDKNISTIDYRLTSK